MLMFMPMALAPSSCKSHFSSAVLDLCRYTDALGEATEAYPFNPNGSPDGIAALTSANGRHLAIMPHPERCFMTWQNPWCVPDLTCPVTMCQGLQRSCQETFVQQDKKSCVKDKWQLGSRKGGGFTPMCTWICQLHIKLRKAVVVIFIEAESKVLQQNVQVPKGHWTDTGRPQSLAEAVPEREGMVL